MTKQQEEDREDNTQYSKREYWEERFTDEEHKEWLAGEYTAHRPRAHLVIARYSLHTSHTHTASHRVWAQVTVSWPRAWLLCSNLSAASLAESRASCWSAVATQHWVSMLHRLHWTCFRICCLHTIAAFELRCFISRSDATVLAVAVPAVSWLNCMRLGELMPPSPVTHWLCCL